MRFLLVFSAVLKWFSGRKTEEGFLIYKEAELGINPEAGGEFTAVHPAFCSDLRRHAALSIRLRLLLLAVPRAQPSLKQRCIIVSRQTSRRRVLTWCRVCH